MLKYEMALVRFQKRNLPEPIVFKLPFDWVLVNQAKDWIDVPVTYFGGPVAKGRVQIEGVSFKWNSISSVSGNFSVELADGTKLGGSFQAKGIKPRKKIICE